MCYLEANHEGTLRIEPAVDMGPGCILVTTSHKIGDSGRRAQAFASKDVVIGAGSWLGARVTVLPGSRIGPGCVVGANTLIDGEYPPNSVIVGTPGRIVRTLDQAELGNHPPDALTQSAR
jgi:maltose O-acetyltransferase